MPQDGRTDGRGGAPEQGTEEGAGLVPQQQMQTETAEIREAGGCAHHSKASQRRCGLGRSKGAGTKRVRNGGQPAKALGDAQDLEGGWKEEEMRVPASSSSLEEQHPPSEAERDRAGVPQKWEAETGVPQERGTGLGGAWQHLLFAT